MLEDRKAEELTIPAQVSPKPGAQTSGKQVHGDQGGKDPEEAGCNPRRPHCRRTKSYPLPHILAIGTQTPEWSRNGHFFNAENHDNLQMSHFLGQSQEAVRAERRWQPLRSRGQELSTFTIPLPQAPVPGRAPEVPRPLPLNAH